MDRFETKARNEVNISGISDRNFTRKILAFLYYSFATKKQSGLQLNGNDLYIAEADGNKISKFNLPSLSVEDYQQGLSVYLYPNPATSFIQVSGLTKIEEFNIYNLSGVEVLKGKISNNGNINIQKLSKGLYILKVDSGNTRIFIKK